MKVEFSRQPPMSWRVPGSTVAAAVAPGAAGRGTRGMWNRKARFACRGTEGSPGNEGATAECCGGVSRGHVDASIHEGGRCPGAARESSP